MTTAGQKMMGSAGGAPAFKFARLKDAVTGVIVALEDRQQIDYKTKRPATWDDGNPKEQTVITLQTEEARDAEDNGQRRVFVDRPSDMLGAIRDAVLDAGSTEPEIGGKLRIQFTGTERVPGLSDKKLYTAQYRAPEEAEPPQEEPDLDDTPF